MKNRFKGSDLINRVPEKLWTGVQHCRGDGYQNHPQEKEMQKGKVFVWGVLTNSWEKKKSERQGRKGKIYPFECRVPENNKERWESLLKWIMQGNRKQQNGKD